ncbi:MAG TPA: hypothetical protein QF624_11125 [Dehalococcoidia bacterium]|nr:hypothetical protein [Dehalococcoidia bacterium]
MLLLVIPLVLLAVAIGLHLLSAGLDEGIPLAVAAGLAELAAGALLAVAYGVTRRAEDGNLSSADWRDELTRRHRRRLSPIIAPLVIILVPVVIVVTGLCTYDSQFVPEYYR